MQCDVVGICHYRRYFECNNSFISKEEIESILQDCDIIVSNSECTQYKNVREHYNEMHVGKDMELCKEVLHEKYPEYDDLIQDTQIFKLTYRMPLKKETVFGEKTFYGHIYENEYE